MQCVFEVLSDYLTKYTPQMGPNFSCQNKPSKHLLTCACTVLGQTTGYKACYTGYKVGVEWTVPGVALQHCSLMLGIWCL